MPFEGGFSSTANGTLLLAVAAALLHLAGGPLASPLRRTVAAAAPAALMAVLCLTRQGPPLLALAFAAAAVGDLMLARAEPRLRTAARAAFGFALVFSAALLGQALAGGFVPAWRLAAAAVAWLALAAGTVPAFLDAARARLGDPAGRAAVALRHAGVVALGLVVLG